MTTIHDNVPNGNSAHATTTEELIVQYLDGELVRNELETVLFDRLSRSEAARTLLREYLVVRGAIRMSREDERFQLADDLDERTRGRIEQMLETIATEDVPAGFLADQEAIATSAMARRMKRWTMRPALAMLALLIAVGTTWFVTRTTDLGQGPKQQALQNPNVSTPMANVAPVPPATPEAVMPSVKSHSMMHFAHTTTKAVTPAPSFAQNSSQASEPKAIERTSNEEVADPADVMISRRYAKAIGAAKHEVVVSGRDRL